MFARCLSLGMLVCATAWGQTVSLSDAQQQSLAALVKTNQQAAALFKSIQREADEALKASPQPIATIHTEGRLKTDPARIQTVKSLEDMKKLRALGYAFAVTSDGKYADKLKAFLVAWARVNQPTGDPIDETNLEGAIIAYDLARKSFAANEAAAVEGWLRKVAEAEIRSRKDKAATSFNNWNSHRLKIVGLAGFALGDKPLIQYAMDGYKQQIGANLKPDGSSFDFHERDALHYHTYDLEPLLALATAAKLNGVDVYSYQAPNGASLDKSIRFLVPFCTGEKTHGEFVNSKVAFDKKRADSGDAHYKAGRLFEPKEATAVFEAAALFNPQYRAMWAKLSGKPDSEYASWPLVVNAVRFPTR